jgi:hypothetical protein
MHEPEVPATDETIDLDDVIDPDEVDHVVAVLRKLIKSVSSAALKEYLREVRADVTRLIEEVELPTDLPPEDEPYRPGAAA